MNPILRKDLLDLEQILDKAKENGIDFLNALDQVPATIIPSAIKSVDLSENGEGALAAMSFFKQHYQQLIVSSSNYRYKLFRTLMRLILAIRRKTSLLLMPYRKIQEDSGPCRRGLTSWLMVKKDLEILLKIPLHLQKPR